MAPLAKRGGLRRFLNSQLTLTVQNGIITPLNVCSSIDSYAKGGKSLVAEIHVKEGESLDSALRRFKRSTARSGVLAEVRKREAYEKPSVRRKKKSEAARKRKNK